MRKEKISSTVQFPEKLDLKKWAPHSSKFKLKYANVLFIDHSSKQNAVYNLYGISHHSGSLYSGHYVG